MNRKSIVFIILIVTLIISGISNIILFLNFPHPITQRDPTTLVVATSSGPNTLEIVDSWDSASEDVLEQVVETLFSHDLGDPNLPRINLLAESYNWKNDTTLHIKLREGVLFHDGTAFNAWAVKWNLDRLQYLINATGENTGAIAFTRSLWMRPDGTTPIINSTSIIEEFNITITLNGPYGPFLNLLTYINAGMISPTFHEADEHNFIPLTGDICGTGPFTYDSYTYDVQVILSRWERYWRPLEYFRKLKFAIVDDYIDAHELMMNGQVDFNFLARSENIVNYETSNDITVKHYTDDTGIPSTVYTYLGFNNENINKTFRKAMSYAINYSHIVEDLRHNEVIRAKSPISPSFGFSFNETTKYLEFNITKAREVMVSMGFGNVSWTDDQWIAIAEGSNPYLVIKYTYIYGNAFREDLGVALMEWFEFIGIRVDDDGYTWIEALTWGITYDGIFSSAWAPDYLDPFNMLDPLVNPRSYSNIALINDTKLNFMMELALNTTNDIMRENIYKNIQSCFAEEGYFHAPLYHSKVICAHSADLREVPYNAIGKFQVYGIYRI